MPILIDESVPIPKYYQVYQMIHEKIENGEYPVGTRIPSERVLVDLFNVSRITVVKAVDLLEHELLIERRQGLGNFVTKPEVHVVEKRPSVVSFVIPYGLDQFPTKIIVGAAQSATDNELFLQILPIPQNQSLSVIFHSLSITPTDGIILLARRNELQKFLEEYHKYSQGPVVLIDRFPQNYEGDYVIFDDEKAGYQLTQHLLERGYQRIAFIPGSEVATSSVIGRLRGYKKALEDSGKTFDEDLVFIDYDEPQADEDQTILMHSARRLDLYMRQYQPDAMVVVNTLMLDALTHDFMVLKNQHLKNQLGTKENHRPDDLPEGLYDVGLAAVCDHWQNIKYDHLHVVAFQDGYDLGAVAMGLMIDRLKNPLRSYQHIILPMQMHFF